MKPKLLAWCDFIAPTGFGNVAKNLLDTMHEEYDVSVVGINYFGRQRYDTSKYFVYPVTREDPLGHSLLRSIAAKEKPELIFLFQDIFNIQDTIRQLKDVTPKSKIVLYFPVDGAPFSPVWKLALELADATITYSDWAIQVVKTTLPEFKKPLHKLYHGVDVKTFKLLPEVIRESYKRGFNEIELSDKFIVSNVNRFQPRKAIPLTVRAYSMFANGYKKCLQCGNTMPIHLTQCDLNGCPSEALVIPEDSKPKSDVFLYLHMMPHEMSMGPTTTCSLHSIVYNAGFRNKDVSKLVGLNGRNLLAGEVSEEEVNIIYNISNVNISSTTGEGCGLSLLEAQASGTPSIAPNNSAIPEMLNGTGLMVKNNATYTHALDNGIVRPHVDPNELRIGLEYYYNKWIANGRKKVIHEECIKNIHDNFLWGDKVEFLKGIFKEVLK